MPNSACVASIELQEQTRPYNGQLKKAGYSEELCWGGSNGLTREFGVQINGLRDGQKGISPTSTASVPYMTTLYNSMISLSLKSFNA